VRECDFVLGTDLLADDDFANIPVFVERVHVPIQRLELWPTEDSHVQCFGSKEGVFVEQVAGIAVRLIGKEGATELVEIGTRYSVSVRGM